MTDRMKTGRRGETLAHAYLLEKGYRIEATNYRYRRTEIDIVARHQDILVFVEVKTRSSLAFGHPSIFFGKQQQGRISRAASKYMEETGYDWEVRFDLIAIYLPSSQDYRLDHYEDVFFPGLH
ncbi:YraN family protein [Lewinella sp. JB7]|uniref:YraN family protein n=1 Tax=Lewinella sp. JB7 TaxID=2962887 RepID=UPI0020C9ACD3|nr:YraN family protein [Lewinella sp. JB7]MCP9236739.1 YraN family protein [Lewinella sp. JB7]